MHDYNDINAEATGQQLHEQYIPIVASFMHMKQHTPIDMVWMINKAELEKFILIETCKLQKFGKDLGMPRSTMPALQVLIRCKATIAHCMILSTHPLDGYQRTPRPSQEERAAISADLSLLDFDCAVPGFHPFFAGDVQYLD